MPTRPRCGSAWHYGRSHAGNRPHETPKIPGDFSVGGRSGRLFSNPSSRQILERFSNAWHTAVSRFLTRSLASFGERIGFVGMPSDTGFVRGNRLAGFVRGERAVGVSHRATPLPTLASFGERLTAGVGEVSERRNSKLVLASFGERLQADDILARSPQTLQTAAGFVRGNRALASFGELASWLRSGKPSGGWGNASVASPDDRGILLGHPFFQPTVSGESPALASFGEFTRWLRSGKPAVGFVRGDR